MVYLSLQILQISEKNLLLIAHDKIIEIYKINNNKLERLLYDKVENPEINIYKINSELFLIYEFCNSGDTYFLKIEYNSNDEPIRMSHQRYINYNLYLMISDASSFYVLDEYNIVCFNGIELILLSRTLDNEFYAQNKIRAFKFFPAYSYIQIDKINKIAILFYFALPGNVCIHFYEFNDNFKFKKQINFQKYYFPNFKRIFNIIDKDNYAYIYNNKLYIISSKYLEVVTIYNLGYSPDDFYVSNKLNQILIKYGRFICIYKFIDNDLKLIDIHCYPIYRFDLEEINEKGDFLLITLITKNKEKYKKGKRFIYQRNAINCYIANYSENKRFLFKYKLINCYNDLEDDIESKSEGSIDDDIDEERNSEYEYDSDYENHSDYENETEYENDYNILLKKKKKGKYKMKKYFRKFKKERMAKNKWQKYFV